MICSSCKRERVVDIERQFRALIEDFIAKWLPHLPCDGAKDAARRALAELLAVVIS